MTPNAPQYMSVLDVSIRLGVGKSTVNRLIHSGCLVAKRFGTQKLYVSIASVMEHERRCEVRV